MYYVVGLIFFLRVYKHYYNNLGIVETERKHHDIRSFGAMNTGMNELGDLNNFGSWGNVGSDNVFSSYGQLSGSDYMGWGSKNNIRWKDPKEVQKGKS